MSEKHLSGCRTPESSLIMKVEKRVRRPVWSRYAGVGLFLTGFLTIIFWTLALNLEAAKAVEVRSAMGRCLEVSGGKNANGTNIRIYDCNATDSQRWNPLNVAVAKSAGGVTHWRLISETNAASEVISSRKKYRFVTEGGQLTPDPNVFEGFYLRPVKNRYPDTRIDPSQGEVKLNERVAIWMSTGEIYLVYNKNAGGPKLGYKRYSPSAEPAYAPPIGIHQWIFKSIPDSKTRDHRKRAIKTKERVALYNEKVKAYLVYDRNRKKLRWKGE